VKIYVDADGIPYRDIVLEQARRYGITVVVVTDYSHHIPPEKGMLRVVVEQGQDSVDFAIVNRVQEGDLVITQDVGLASLILPKRAAVISPRGYEFTESSISRRLTLRWLNRKIRLAGGRVRGPKPLSQDDRKRFLALLERKLTALMRRADATR
jgi:uncharacterized protein YaiI (UPF0178 family)